MDERPSHSPRSPHPPRAENAVIVPDVTEPDSLRVVRTPASSTSGRTSGSRRPDSAPVPQPPPTLPPARHGGGGGGVAKGGDTAAIKLKAKARRGAPPAPATKPGAVAVAYTSSQSQSQSEPSPSAGSEVDADAEGVSSELRYTTEPDSFARTTPTTNENVTLPSISSSRHRSPMSPMPIKTSNLPVDDESLAAAAAAATSASSAPMTPGGMASGLTQGTRKASIAANTTSEPEGLIVPPAATLPAGNVDASPRKNGDMMGYTSKKQHQIKEKRGMPAVVPGAVATVEHRRIKGMPAAGTQTQQPQLSPTRPTTQNREKSTKRSAPEKASKPGATAVDATSDTEPRVKSYGRFRRGEATAAVAATAAMAAATAQQQQQQPPPSAASMPEDVVNHNEPDPSLKQRMALLGRSMAGLGSSRGYDGDRGARDNTHQPDDWDDIAPIVDVEDGSHSDAHMPDDNGPQQEIIERDASFVVVSDDAQKAPFYSRRTCWIALVVVAVAIIVGGIVGIVIAINSKGKNTANSASNGNEMSSAPIASPTPSPVQVPTVPPTPAPTVLPAEVMRWEDLIQKTSLTNTSFENPTSPQSLALEWMRSDPYSARSDDATLVQRFSLVDFWYSTNGSGWDPSEQVWLQSDSECSWTGVSCSPSGLVTELNLHDFNVAGTIPREIVMLSQLTSLNISLGSLTGFVPTEIGQLTELYSLQLPSHSLKGSIPSELGMLSLLRILRLDKNQFEGLIPTELSQLGALEELYLQGNSLTGSIPYDSLPTNLTSLDLSTNSLEGSISTLLGRLTKLESLVLGRNALAGKIPTELGELSALANLGLDSAELTGTIPTEIGRLTALSKLYLLSNNLSGSIPTELALLKKFWGIGAIVLSRNNLSGSISSATCDITAPEIDCGEITCATSTCCLGSNGSSCG